MPLIPGFNSRSTENEEPMTVGELAESLRGVENRVWDLDSKDRERWRNAKAVIVVKDEEGNSTHMHIYRVGYACTARWPFIYAKKTTYPKRDVAQLG